MSVIVKNCVGFIGVIFLLLFDTACLAQDWGTLKGIAQLDGTLMSFVPIQLKGTTFGTGTDDNGRFTIEAIPVGEYILEVNSLLYEKVEIRVTIRKLETTFVTIQLKEAIITKEEIVITGTLTETSKLKSPIAVEVYSPQFFKKQPAPSIFESLSMVNGVQPQLNCSVCNTGDIHINGMEGPYTMILIDGMPIVSSLSTVYGLSGIPNSLVKRIEVVKGPAATLYGSEAVGGLINIITQDPTSVHKVQLDVMGSSYQDLNVDLSGKIKAKQLSVIMGANYFTFNKRWDINKDNFTDITLQNRISLFSKLSWNRKVSRNATLAIRYVYEDRFGGELQWNEKFRGSDSIYGESIYTKRIEVIGDYQLPIKNQKVNFQYSYNAHDQNSYYGLVSYQAIQHTAFGQLLWTKKWAARHNVLVGVPLRYIYYDDNTAATQSVVDSLITIPSRTVLPGIFVQDEWKLSEKWTTLIGARYDYHNLHGNIYSPRISFKWSPNPSNTFRISGGNGFRVVNLFTEDHAALTGSREVVIIEKLRPEESWNVNLNYVKFVNFKKGYLGIDGSLFYTYFSNKIVGDFLTDPTKIIYNNLDGYAVSKGATLNLDVSFTSGFKWITGITWMDVYTIENVGGVAEKIPQLFAPQFSGTYQLGYTWGKAKLSFDYTGRVYGPMYLPVVENDFRPETSPWFDIANVQVTKKFKKMEWYTGVKNLWNFIPKDPILRPFDPFDKNITVANPNNYRFDTTYNYASMQGTRVFLGVRWQL